jgi:hypothetical protein
LDFTQTTVLLFVEDDTTIAGYSSDIKDGSSLALVNINSLSKQLYISSFSSPPSLGTINLTTSILQYWLITMIETPMRM